MNKAARIGIIFIALLIISGVVLMYKGNDAVVLATEKKEGILTAEQIKLAFDSVGGRMIKEAVIEGQRVKAGDVIMVLDPTDTDLAIEKLKAQIAQLDAQIKSTGGSMDVNLFRADNDEQQSFRQIDSQRAAVASAQATLFNCQLDFDRGGSDRSIGFGQRDDGAQRGEGERPIAGTIIGAIIGGRERQRTDGFTQPADDRTGASLRAEHAKRHRGAQSATKLFVGAVERVRDCEGTIDIARARGRKNFVDPSKARRNDCAVGAGGIARNRSDLLRYLCERGSGGGAARGRSIGRDDGGGSKTSRRSDPIVDASAGLCRFETVAGEGAGGFIGVPSADIH